MHIFNIFGGFVIPATVAVMTTPAQPQIIRLEIPEAKIDKTTTLDFTDLKGTGLSKISYSYLGFSGEIPNERTVDWNQSLKKLWDQKLRFKNVSKATQSAAPAILADYEKEAQERMSIPQHIKDLEKDLINIKRDLNWGKICALGKLDSSTCKSFVMTAWNIDAKALTAYSMTELMPYRNGNQNYVLMNLYMEQAGRNYLDNVPALGDKYLSLGRYQFTSFAVGHDKDGPRPANKIASYSTNYNISGSVISLKGIENDRAAYYFATYNLLSLFKKMDGKKLAKYDRYCDHKTVEIVEYIATAHHNPKWARKRALSWINDKCEKPLESYQGERLKVYSIKTRVNYNAIKEA